MKRKGSRKSWAWYGIAGIVLAAVGLSIYSEATKPLPVQTAVITRGAIQAYVEERGRTSLPHIYHITMPLPGRILPIELREGDPVTTGQVVATLEDLDWKDAATSVREMLVAMKNAVNSATAEIKATRARLDYSRWLRDATKQAKETEALSAKQVREAEWNFLDAAAKSEESQTDFHAVNAIYSMVKLFPPFVDRNLDRTRVRSPVDGVILKRHVWNEKTMMPGSKLLDIGDLRQLEVTADILSEEAVRVQKGDPVLIFGEAIGGDPIRGTVRRIKPEAFTKLSSLGVEQQRVPVEIAFTPEDLKALKERNRTLGLHYRVRVRIVTDEKEQALLIPRTALFRGADGGWEAFRVVEGRARLVTLEIGLMNDLQAEVLAGLQEGEEVILAPESTLAGGARVMASDSGS